MTTYLDAENHKIGDVLNYTAGSDLVAGTLVAVAGRCGMLCSDIDAGDTGSVLIRGLIRVRQTAVAFTAGDNIYWDNDGSPVVGEASSGGAAAAGDLLTGSAAYDSLNTDEWVIVDLNTFTNASIVN